MYYRKSFLSSCYKNIAEFGVKTVKRKIFLISVLSIVLLIFPVLYPVIVNEGFAKEDIIIAPSEDRLSESVPVVQKDAAPWQLQLRVIALPLFLLAALVCDAPGILLCSVVFKLLAAWVAAGPLRMLAAVAPRVIAMPETGQNIN
jgi:hypothetical protein